MIFFLRTEIVRRGREQSAAEAAGNATGDATVLHLLLVYIRVVRVAETC